MPNHCIFPGEQPGAFRKPGCLQDGWSVTDGTNAVVDGMRLGLLAPHGGPAQGLLVNRVEGAVMASTALAPAIARTASLPLVVLLARK